MSDEHSSSSGSSKKNVAVGLPEEDGENERLWSDFENCAQSVTRLYRDPTWKCLQTAAAATTQLYKSSLDSQRRGFEKGFQAGSTSLAKEVLTAFSSGNKADLNTLLELLYRNMGRTSDDAQKGQVAPVISGETVAAVHLFQQALNPSFPSSPPRSSDLNAFLSNQVQRHRKRQRSPSSPSSLIKRLRKS